MAARTKEHGRDEVVKHRFRAAYAVLGMLFLLSFFLPVLDFGELPPPSEPQPVLVGVWYGWDAAQVPLDFLAASFMRHEPFEALLCAFLCAANPLILMSLVLGYRLRYRGALLAGLLASLSSFYWYVSGWSGLEIGYWAWLGSAVGAMFLSACLVQTVDQGRRRSQAAITLLRDVVPPGLRLWQDPE